MTRQSVFHIPLDWIDTVLILVGLYGTVAAFTAFGVESTNVVTVAALGVAVGIPILRRRFFGPPAPYREDRSKPLSAFGLILIGVGSLVLGLGGILGYLRVQDHQPWQRSALGCVVGLGALVIGGTIDWLQRDHRR